MFILLCSFALPSAWGQNTFIEAGIGIGNVLEAEHRPGKAEIHLGIFHSFQFGKLGLDFSSGGNFLPVGSEVSDDENIDVVSPYGTGFGTIALLYRLPIKKYFFIEPRIGYTSLSSFVHTDDTRKAQKSNLSTGIGIGGNLANLTLSLRYHHLGKTTDFMGFSSVSNRTVQLSSTSVSVILLRFSYRFSLDKFFKSKDN